MSTSDVRFFSVGVNSSAPFTGCCRAKTFAFRKITPTKSKASVVRRKDPANRVIGYIYIYLCVSSARVAPER